MQVSGSSRMYNSVIVLTVGLVWATGGGACFVIWCAAVATVLDCGSIATRTDDDAHCVRYGHDKHGDERGENPLDTRQQPGRRRLAAVEFNMFVTIFASLHRRLVRQETVDAINMAVRSPQRSQVPTVWRARRPGANALLNSHASRAIPQVSWLYTLATACFRPCCIRPRNPVLVSYRIGARTFQVQPPGKQ